jgi:DNA polymerase III gamma/tau subunit
MKIGELIEKYDGLVKSAFIPNPQPMQQESQLQQLGMQLQQAMASQPPEAQQQIQSFLAQITTLPPDQQIEQVTNLLGQLQQQPQQASQPAPEQPQAQQSPQPDTSAAGAEQAAFSAENTLDNTKITLSVRELLDLSNGGKATQSLLKIKQMADAHNKKMEAVQQQQEQQAAAQSQEQSMAAQPGGIYSQPMNAAPMQ